MAPVPAFVAVMLANTAFRSIVTGAGFFSDSYDLFITDGVTNILKNLGPVNAVTYKYNVNVNTTATVKVYFNGLCDTTASNNKGVNCLPYLWDTPSASWKANPNSVYTDEMLPRYQAQSTDLKNAVSNAALIGSILGQLFFGFVGDSFGRKWNFVITSFLIILGALGSATSSAGITMPNCAPVQLGPATLFGSNTCTPSSSYYDVYMQLVVWRGILGFGVGGEYPLASTITGESANMATRGVAILSIFSMQGWGKLTAAIVNYSLIATLNVFGGPWVLDGTWRFALAFGCALNLLTIYFRWHLSESKIYLETKAKELGIIPHTTTPSAKALMADAEGTPVEAEPGATTPAPLAITDEVVPVTKPLHFWTTLRVLWEFKWILIGTASTWFLIDVTFYGQSLMNTTVVNSAVASTAGLNTITSLRQSLLSTIYIMLIALPGYWCAIATIKYMGRYWMTQMGFLASAICFAVLCGYNGTTGLGNTAAASAGFVVVYGLTYFFANFGPNSTTFLMAAEAFPTRVRTTAHGISAACGKIGATAGSYGLLSQFNAYCTQTTTGASISPPLCTVNTTLQTQIASGVVTIMAICVGVSIAGNIMTTIFLKETGNKELAEVDASSEVLRKLDEDEGRSSPAPKKSVDDGAAAATPAAPGAAVASPGDVVAQTV